MAASVAADIQRGSALHLLPPQALEVHVMKHWDGSDGPRTGGHAVLTLASTGHGLQISFEAPFYNDAPPSPTPDASPDASQPLAGAPVRCGNLWEYEVLELFLVAVPPESSEGQEYEYLELEWGPAGHFLALKLAGFRNVVDHMLEADLSYGARAHMGPVCATDNLPLSDPHAHMSRNHHLEWAVDEEKAVWSGTLTVPAEYFPARADPMTLFHYNMFHIHGEGTDRVYRAAHAVPGEFPDFHRLQYFPPLELEIGNSNGGGGSRADDSGSGAVINGGCCSDSADDTAASQAAMSMDYRDE